MTGMQLPFIGRRGHLLVTLLRHHVYWYGVWCTPHEPQTTKCQSIGLQAPKSSWRLCNLNASFQLLSTLRPTHMYPWSEKMERLLVVAACLLHKWAYEVDENDHKVQELFYVMKSMIIAWKLAPPPHSRFYMCWNLCHHSHRYWWLCNSYKKPSHRFIKRFSLVSVHLPMGKLHTCRLSEPQIYLRRPTPWTFAVRYTKRS